MTADEHQDWRDLTRSTQMWIKGVIGALPYWPGIWFARSINPNERPPWRHREDPVFGDRTRG